MIDLFPEPVSLRSPRAWFVAVFLLALAAVPLVAAALDDNFYITVAARIVVFALAATGLNLILGYGGMVSFGHALYVGLGAYIVGILGFHGIANGWIQLAATLLLCSAIGGITGLICLRCTGIAFIMITLAFAQMFYFLGVSLQQYGGDDGTPLAARSDFWPLSIDSNAAFYYFAVVILFVALYFCWRLVHSRFGRVLRATKSNSRRMRVLGFPILRYQVTAYVISACLCGVTGLLLANLTLFMSPGYMYWTVSGDLVVMVMLGGISTIVGPVVGAVVYILLETVVSGYTEHWMIITGPVIVLIALLAKRGIYGFIAR